MMNIAIVDDMANDRAAIRKQLEAELIQRGITATLEEFDSGEAFQDAFTPGRFAVAFLDIYMKQMTGIEVGHTLYAQDPGCKIIFLTSSEEFFRESYSVRATYYLVKPFELTQLQQALDFCFPKPEPADILTIRTKEGTSVVSRQDIFYIEARGRYPHIHLKDKSLESLENFTEVVRPLEADKRFFCCCRGIVVHLGKISTQKDNDFIMEDGQMVPISRRIKPEALRAFHAYMFGTAKETLR